MIIWGRCLYLFKQQKIAMILMPILAIAILFGGNAIFGGPKGDVYEGVGQGFSGEIKVKITMAEDEILSIDITEINDTPGLGDTAAQEVAANIVAAQSTEVDTVSGATLSSQGTIEAVENALAGLSLGGGSSMNLELEDGEYEGTGNGFVGDIKLKVLVEGGKVSDIELLDFNDTPGIGDAAAESIIQDIINKQSVEIDGVSGATVSSEGVIQAVKNALEL